MSKEKDLNDASKELMATGRKPQLKLVELGEDYDLGPNFLEEMNQKHAFINSFGGKPAILCYTYSEVFDRELIEFRSPDSIITQYCNQTAEGGKNGDTPVPLGKWWIGHINRREYDTVTFEPEKQAGEYKHPITGKSYYNLWEGYAEQPIRGSWQKTLRHCYKIISNGDARKFKYFIKWLAWCVQNPGTRPEVAVILKGKKGAGKGFIFTQMVKLFGRHGMCISNREHLTGKHNEHLMMLSFLFADEAYAPGDKEVLGTMNRIITEETITVEPKFRGTKIARNCLHVAMATNNDWVIPASEDERRYYINEVSNTYAKNQISDAKRFKYFRNLWGEMENGGRAAMLYDLIHMDLGDWHPREDVPETIEMQRQKTLSLPRRDKCILAFLEHGIFPGKQVGRNEYHVNGTILNEYIEKIDPGSIKITMRNKGIVLNELGVFVKRTAEERYWVFPSLIQLKDVWNRVKGHYEWDDHNDWEVVRKQPIDTI